MFKHCKIKQAVAEKNAVLPLPPITPPLTSPFPIPLPNGGTVYLAKVNIPVGHDHVGVLLSATVNWSATFTPSEAAAVTTPGFATVIFEILLDDFVIYRVTQTALQQGAPSTATFAAATSTFEIATLLHFDIVPGCHYSGCRTYTLRTTNILLTPPVISAGRATATAAVGAVTLVAEEHD